MVALHIILLWVFVELIKNFSEKYFHSQSSEFG